MKYFKTIWKVFIDSFKLKLPYVFVLAYEILFVLTVTALTFPLPRLLGAIGEKFTVVAPSRAALTPGAVDELKGFIFQSVSVFVGFMLAVLLAYLIFQSLAWLQITGGKHSKRFFWKFLLANFIWLLPWLFVMWFFVTGLSGKHAAYGLIFLAILFVYQTFIMQNSFVRDPHLGIRKALGAAFSIGIGRIYLFIIPLLLAAVVFVIWSQVWRLVPQIENLGFGLIILASLVFAPFLAWFKFYIDKLLAAIA